MMCSLVQNRTWAAFDALQHQIHLKTRDLVYVKQFKIPDVHREAIEKHVKEWLALGIVEPARSRYNSSMFCVGKKDGSLRLVRDFWGFKRCFAR